MPRPARKPSKTRKINTCKIDVLVQSGLWEEPGKAKTTLRRAVRAAAAALSTTGAELAIVLADDSAVRLLNRQWRGIDKATNVLSFPTETADGEPPLLGDIVLAYETIAREACDEGKPFAHHLAHLAVHGFLHLNGYDHQRDADAEAMEALERKILRRLAIADPYRPRARAHGKPAKKSARKSARAR
jgi:probable rRNA maturation factor